jgi:hypothetical protein
LSNNKIEYDVFVWSSDFEDHRGEGILARLFLKKLSVKSSKTFFIKTPGNSYLVNRGNINIVKKGLFKLNFYNKYIILFFGVFLIWVNLFKKKKIIYLNYLPLWNFLIFIFLPRKTIIGPITGGGFFFNVSFFQRIIRKFFFPLLYFLSLKIIDKKFENVVFSTNLLSKYVNLRSKKIFFFNFCLLSYQNLKYPKKKEIDFFIYYKINSTKNPFILNKIIHFLTKIGLKVIVVGDRINNKKVVYYSHLARDKIFSFLKKTKFSIISNENFYSLFCIDCISSGVKVFFDKRTKPNIFFFNKSNYIPIDFNNLNEINANIKNWSTRYNFIDYKVNNKFNLEIKKLNFFINKLRAYF